MAPTVKKEYTVVQMLEEIISNYLVARFCILYFLFAKLEKGKKRKRLQIVLPYSLTDRVPSQVSYMNRLVGVNDTDCLVNLRMDRNAFGRLCSLFRQLGNLRDRRFVYIEEQVAIFISILAHHTKNRRTGFHFLRSGETISTSVHTVLKAIIKMHTLFLVKPEPIKADCVDWRWKHFKGCLGALDGTYINMLVPNSDKPRFRNRKGQITTNTLAACDRHMRFTYVLPGWEGSAGDARVLRDAVNRPYGLKVPLGNYYLYDNGYVNRVSIRIVNSI
ncbi:uncharacterized protein LOC121761829 isoform X2 [Salvia splendens]|uniref:uncharacterized protein LOC121761829 isoform X2 n=1 Tax=Salvia splendens TaxID=180675 RepID=UPI001C264644|nr:uncharacterized protein LOC121761829 isoform X2 [Salvia splendens]